MRKKHLIPLFLAAVIFSSCAQQTAPKEEPDMFMDLAGNLAAEIIKNTISENISHYISKNSVSSSKYVK